MKKSHFILAIAVVILLIAALTNPNEQKHREAIKDKISAYVDEKIGNNSALGSLFGRALMDRAVDSMVARDNYLIFSLTKVGLLGQTKVVGLGILGTVIIFGDVEDLATSSPL